MYPSLAARPDTGSGKYDAMKVTTLPVTRADVARRLPTTTTVALATESVPGEGHFGVAGPEQTEDCQNVPTATKPMIAAKTSRRPIIKAS
jgi:hypothetical protein